MFNLILPERLDFNALMIAIRNMGELQCKGDIAIDFQNLRFITPAGMAPLAALIDRWIHQDYSVSLRNAPNCGPFEYLQRMDFFKVFGIYPGEKFERHPASGQFASLEQIGIDSNAKRISTNLSNCISGGQEFPLVRSDLDNCIYESVNNIIDHSDIYGNRCGFAVAQSYRFGIHDRKYVIAIADSGQGVSASLQNNPDLQIHDDLEALNLACIAGITSTPGKKNDFGDPRNVGLGLNSIDRIAESTRGSFVLSSGNVYRFRRAEKVSLGTLFSTWQGTVVIVTLTYSGVRRHHESITRKGRIQVE